MSNCRIKVEFEDQDFIENGESVM